MLLAAGRGTRFGGEVPKVWLLLAGKPVILHSAERLCLVAPPANSRSRLVVVVNPADRERHLQALLPHFQALADCAFVDGGSTRQESMRRGLAACPEHCDLVLIHDAARALFPVAAARECVATAERRGAAFLGVPAQDTPKIVRGDKVEITLDRSGLWLAQTPQVIRRELLVRALAHAAATGYEGTDDVSLVEHLGEEVAVVAGSPTNLKITRAEDLALAAALLSSTLHP